MNIFRIEKTCVPTKEVTHPNKMKLHQSYNGAPGRIGLHNMKLPSEDIQGEEELCPDNLCSRASCTGSAIPNADRAALASPAASTMPRMAWRQKMKHNYRHDRRSATSIA